MRGGAPTQQDRRTGTRLRGWMDGYARRQSDDIDDVSGRRRARVNVWQIGREKQKKIPRSMNEKMQ